MSCLAHLQVLSAQRGKTVRKTERSGDTPIYAMGLLLCARGDGLHGAGSAAANLCQCFASMGWATADLARWMHPQAESMKHVSRGCRAQRAAVHHSHWSRLLC